MGVNAIVAIVYEWVRQLSDELVYLANKVQRIWSMILKTWLG